MMDNIAVVLRGHYRTWGYVHPAVFDFYDEIAKNVDYYFVTWNRENLYIGNIVDPFIKYNKNLVKLLTVHPDDAYYTSYLGPSYLSYQIIPYMMERHNQVKYDFVFNTRPDIIYKMQPNHNMPALCNDTLYTTDYVCQWNGREDDVYHIGLQDHFFASSFDINLIMNMRHHKNETMGCHNQLLQRANDYGIKTAALYKLRSSIVRPIAFEKCPDPTNYFDTDYYSYAMDWVDMPKEDKLILLQKYYIPQDDYITNSILAKI